jgi:hypothetical protein
MQHRHYPAKRGLGRCQDSLPAQLAPVLVRTTAGCPPARSEVHAIALPRQFLGLNEAPTEPRSATLAIPELEKIPMRT